MHSLPVWFVPLILTLIAGLATGVGGLLGVWGVGRSTRFFSGALGFSAGVMIYISLVEIMPEGIESLEPQFGDSAAWWGVGAMFAGIAFTALVDGLIPATFSSARRVPGDTLGGPALNDPTHWSKSLMRTGVFTALAISLHNFPEGFATFIAALSQTAIAAPIVVAVAIHNIPEGLAVAVPLYKATGSKRHALIWSLASGLAEPAGAVVGWLILAPFMSDTLFGIVFAAVGGIMLYLSFSELIPTAHGQGHNRTPVFGLILGMAVMALSLLLLG